MQLIRSATATLMLVATGPRAGSAQVPFPIMPLDSGRYVRVTTTSVRETGHLLARYVRGDATLQLCTAPWQPCGAGGNTTGKRSYSTAELLRLEVHRGSHARTGAIIGGVAGAVVGGLLGYVVAAVCDAAECAPLGQGVLVGGLAGGVSVGLVGAGIGGLFPRWGPAP
jgi:hypothetical protein